MSMAAMANINFVNFYDQLRKASSDHECSARLIAQALEAISDEQDAKRESLQKALATKEDLNRFATKEDLAREIAKCATKEGLADLAKEIAKCATKDDLNQYATKLEVHQVISSAKWQVIGSVAAMLFVGFASKHFGF